MGILPLGSSLGQHCCKNGNAVSDRTCPVKGDHFCESCYCPNVFIHFKCLRSIKNYIISFRNIRWNSIYIVFVSSSNCKTILPHFINLKSCRNFPRFYYHISHQLLQYIISTVVYNLYLKPQKMVMKVHFNIIFTIFIVCVSVSILTTVLHTVPLVSNTNYVLCILLHTIFKIYMLLIVVLIFIVFV